MFLCSLRYCLKFFFSKGVYSFTLSTVSQARYGNNILHKGGTMWKLHIWTDQGKYYIWTSLRYTQPAWCEINTQQRRQKVLPGKDMGSPWGESYHGKIHMWDHPKGNHYTRAPSPAQGLILGIHTSAGPGIWLSVTPDYQGCRRNFNRVCQGELNWETIKAHASCP